MSDIDAWRHQLGRLGVWCTTDRMTTAEATRFARLVEQLGYGALWLPETTGRDPFAHIGHLAASTPRLTFATGIANIHHRHPGAMIQAATTLAEQSEDRFLLGLGVSHAPMVEGIRGLDFSKPVATMRRYLEAMAASPYSAVAPRRPVPRLVGALGPKMIALSGECADGIHPYWTTPAHTRAARDILGADKLICVEQKVVLTTDADAFRRTTSKALRAYVGLPNYRNNWLRLGFSDEEIDRLDDRFLDALVAWGDADRVRDRIEAHLAAGADHVCIQPMTPDHPLRPDEDALHALAPHPTTEVTT